MTVSIRAVSVHDVGSLVELLQADRPFQQPWHRTRGEDYFTAAYQRREIVEQVGEYADGVALPYVILDEGDVVGRITVSNVVRGAFHSGDLGYWVTESRNGRGVATAAVAAMLTVAFDEMQLHRLQASTLHCAGDGALSKAPHRSRRVTLVVCRLILRMPCRHTVCSSKSGVQASGKPRRLCIRVMYCHVMTVDLLPGGTLQGLKQSLPDLVSKVKNLRGTKSWNSHGAANAYFEWTVQNQSVLKFLLTREQIDALIFAP